jgi:protein-L-isoaspartate(D-aspartate) O-methyltransferase
VRLRNVTAGVLLRPLMSVEFFDDQRREMIAAIRVIAGHLAAEVGKAALDDRVLNAMAKVPRHEFVPVEVQPCIP